jgi:hypothetical protein
MPESQIPLSSSVEGRRRIQPPLGLLSSPDADEPSGIEPADFLDFDEGADYVGPDGSTEMHHRDGVPWWKAEVPKTRHECWAQTEGWTNYVNRVERCACGAIRLDGAHGVWSDRNSRSDKPAEQTVVASLKRGLRERLGLK